MSAARTFAVMAHVDAGKTTLCEQLLLASGVLRRAGRVDHGDTALDVDPIERERGITVFRGRRGLRGRAAASPSSTRPATSISPPRRRGR